MIRSLLQILEYICMLLVVRPCKLRQHAVQVEQQHAAVLCVCTAAR